MTPREHLTTTTSGKPPARTPTRHDFPFRSTNGNRSPSDNAPPPPRSPWKGDLLRIGPDDSTGVSIPDSSGVVTAMAR